MTTKMVAGFRRSLSFSTPNPNRTSKPKQTLHVRSISLPSRSHPLIPQLKDQIDELGSWGSEPHGRTSAWLCDGLSRLRNIHDSLDDILQLPQTQEALRRRFDIVEKLLENFLRFVDAYGIFQASILALKQEQLAVQVAIRKRDDLKAALYFEAQKKMAKEMRKLGSAVRCAGRCSAPASDGDAEVVGLIREVVDATVTVSLALFNGVGASSALRRWPWVGFRLPKGPKKVKAEEGIQEFQVVGVESFWGLRKKGDIEIKMVLKRVQDLEGCICRIESNSERVFRSLINSRVSLLNILAQ